MTQRLIWIFWPSFLVAIVAVGIFFSMVDPHDLEVLEMPRMGIYTVGFLCFWALAAASSAITVFLQNCPQNEVRKDAERANSGA